MKPRFAVLAPAVMSALFAGVVPVVVHSAGSTGVLSGRVVHGKYHWPVPYTNVALPEVRRGMMAGEDGRFEIRDLEPGDYVVRGMMIGYDVATTEVTILPGQTTEIELGLTERRYGPTDEDAEAVQIGADVSVTALDLGCRLEPAQPVFRVGDKPAFHVRIINNSAESIWLVSSTDGSTDSGRYPQATVKITGPSGILRSTSFRFCGNMNGLTLADFVKVEPGQGFDPFARGWVPSIYHSGAFAEPGPHIVTFCYSTSRQDIRSWLGWPPARRISEEMKGRFRRVPLVQLGCSIEVEVLP